MSFNGAGLFNIDSSGQPVANGQVIDAPTFNALTADLASGLSTCITKDGQQTVTANIPMNSHKFTGLTPGTVTGDSVSYDQMLLTTPWGVNDMRLTLSSGVPVTTIDATNNVLYWARYKGSRCALWDGANWLFFNTGNLSIAIPAVASQMYDVFVYNNAGSPALELLAWTNDTTRAVALTMLNGVPSKTTDLTRRYLGSFRTDAANNGNDTLAKRHLFNYYNRVRRQMYVPISANGYTYTTNTYRQANANTANQLDFVVGVAEDMVTAEIFGGIQSTVASTAGNVAVGVDSTTAAAALALQQPTDANVVLVANTPQASGAVYAGIPAVGRHTLVWLERGPGAGTTTWNIANNTMRGEIWA